MEEQRDGLITKGPEAISGVRDKQLPRTTAADTHDWVWAFADAVVDIGDGAPVPARKFVKLKRSRQMQVAEIARRKGIGIALVPADWTPPKG